VEELITYQQMLDCIGRDDEDAVAWKHRRIVGCQGPLDVNAASVEQLMRGSVDIDSQVTSMDLPK
jgi:hypothetical protein